MVYLQTRFRMPRSNGSLVTAVKLKDKENVCNVVVFTFCKKITLRLHKLGKHIILS
jgi:hypothetical protein